LYFWAPKHPLLPEPGIEELEYCLSQDALAIYLEELALDHALPESAASMIPLSRKERNFEVVDCPRFREFLFWLWILTESYLQSLLQRSPPRICDPQLLLQAASVLQPHRDKEVVRKLLPRIELCQLSLEVNNCCGQQPGANAWLSPPGIILRSFEDLRLLNQKFGRWRERWSYCPQGKVST
jgi:hypothetical protein